MVILLSESFRMQDQDQEFNGMRVRIPCAPSSLHVPLSPPPSATRGYLNIVRIILQIRYSLYLYMYNVYKHSLACVGLWFFFFFITFPFFLFALSYYNIAVEHTRVRPVTRKNKWLENDRNSWSSRDNLVFIPNAFTE